MIGELSYEEALIAAAAFAATKPYPCSWPEATEKARSVLANTCPAVRAALERGPVARVSELVVTDVRYWQSRALAAEARVKELEAKLTDAALVEAGWVPRSVANSAVEDGCSLRAFADRLSDWLSSRAASAKAGGKKEG